MKKEDLIMDTDEICLTPVKTQWEFKYRFANTNIFYTDGKRYNSMEQCMSTAIVNMALKSK